MRLRLARALAPVSALALGCGDQSVLTVTTPRSFPSLNFSSGPGAPGKSGIIRFKDFIGFFVYDFQRGLLSVHGVSTPLADVCAGAPLVVDSLDIQGIQAASGLHAIFQGQEHSVLIYPALPNDCAFLATAPLLAAGTARLVRTDNDLFAEGSPGVNAFGWQAEGYLTDAATGGSLRYTEIVRLIATTDVKELVVDIRLR